MGPENKKQWISLTGALYIVAYEPQLSLYSSTRCYEQNFLADEKHAFEVCSLRSLLPLYLITVAACLPIVAIAYGAPA